MATGGDMPGQNPDQAESEDLDNLKCQLCLEDGLLHEVVGMCVDCNDVLCETCYKGHRRPRPSRNHRLIDKDQMLQDRTQVITKDTCTEKCEVHDNEIIKYYCTRHGLLGCTTCVTLGHSACKDIHYIPHVSKELDNNEEYKQAEKRINSALETFKKVSENAKQYSEELENSCSEAVESIREFRRSADEALGQMEAEMIEKVGEIKAAQMKEIAALGQKYRAKQTELESALGKVEALQQAGQNCGVFTEMMRTNTKLATLDTQINEAMRDISSQKPQIRFTPNQDTLKMMKNTATLGNLSGSTKPAQNINMKAVKSAGSWTCDVCLVNNKTDVEKRVACQSAKPGPSVSKPGSDSVQNDLKSKFKPGAGQWECEVCLVRNGSDVSSCVACQTARPVKSFKHPAGDWTCDTCLVVNKESSVKCVACSYARPGPPRTQTGPSREDTVILGGGPEEADMSSPVAVAGPSRDDTVILGGGPVPEAASGKMKRGKSYHKGSTAVANRQALEEEDTEILPNLTTDFTLPVSAMPRFNFATPTASKAASSSGDKPALNFTFSSPIPENVPTDKPESPEKRGGFQFSSPISVDKQPAGRAPTQSQQEAPKSVPTGSQFGTFAPSGSQEQRAPAASGFSFGSPLNTSSNMQMSFLSAPKPKAKLNGPAMEGSSRKAASELKSGSVMDVLGGSMSAFGSASPASELKQGSVMDILGGSSNKNSSSPKTSFGSGFGSFQASSSSSQSSPFGSSKTAVAGSQSSAASGSLPPLSSMFGGAGWSCDVCLVNNKADTDTCAACQTPKPGPAKPETSPAPPPLSHMFKQSGWTCDACLVTNTSDACKCVACQSARPGGGQATTQKPPPLVAVKSAGSWTCDVCLVNNKTDVDKCVACQSAKPGPSVSKPGSGSLQNDLKSKFKPGAGQWECEICLVRNGSDVSSCVACQTARPVKSFKHPAGDWTCDTCLVVNKECSVKCVACSYARPGPSRTQTGPAMEGSSRKAASELKSGSVMDVLGGSMSAFGSASPASELKQGSVMDILGGSSNKSSSSPKTSFGSGFGSFQAASSSSQSSPFGSSKTAVAGSQSSAASGSLPPLSSMFGGAGWSCDVCLVNNKTDTDTCAACQTPKPGPAKPETSPAPPPLSHMFKQSGWTCDACLVTNTSDACKCVACQSARPGGGQTTTQKPPPLVAVKSAGSWTCDVCLVNNKTDVDKCVACQSAKPGPSVSKPGSGSLQNDLKSKFKPGAGQWECEICLVRNGSDVSSCVACQTARPVKSFKHPAGDWTCDTCLVVNKECSVKCVACSYARPGPPRTQTVPSCVKTFTQSQSGFTPTESSKASNIVVGSAGGFTLLGGDKKEPDTGGFKFGSSSNKKTSESSRSSSAARGGFQFGGSSTSSSSTSGSGFKFGAASSDTKSTPSAGGFTFGSSAPASEKQTSEVKSVETSKAPAAGGFSFGVPASTAQSNSISSGDSDKSVVSTSNALPGGFSFGQSSESKSADPLKATTSVPGGFSFKPSDSSIVSSAKQSEASSQLTSPAAAPSVGGFTFGAASSTLTSVVSTATPSAVTQNSVSGFTFAATKVTQSSTVTVPSQPSESKPAFGASGFSFGSTGSTSTSQSAAPAFGGGFNFAQKPEDSKPSSSPSLKRDRDEDSSATEAKKSLFAFGASTTATNSATPFQFTATNSTPKDSTTTPASSAAGFAFGKSNSTAPSFNFGAGKTEAAPAPVFGAANTTSQFGTGTPAFGTGSSSSSFSSVTSSVAAPASTTQAQSSLFVFGAQSSQQPSTATTPAFRAFSAGSTPAFGAGIAPAFDGSTASTTPAFGAFSAGSTPAFGAGIAPTFGGSTTSTTPAFGAFSAGSTPAFGAGIAPAFGGSTASTTPAFGAFSAGSTPAFGAGIAPAFGGSTASTTPAFGAFSAGSAPAFGAGIAPAFGGSTASTTPAFGSFSAGSTPAFGAGIAPTFGGSTASTTPAFGATPPAFGSTNTTTAAPAFGEPENLSRVPATECKESSSPSQDESHLQPLARHENKSDEEDKGSSTSLVPEVESSCSFFHGLHSSPSNSDISDQSSWESVHVQQSNSMKELGKDDSEEKLCSDNSKSTTTEENCANKAISKENVVDAGKTLIEDGMKNVSSEIILDAGNSSIENKTKKAVANESLDTGKPCNLEKMLTSVEIQQSSQCCQVETDVTAGKSEITMGADKSRLMSEDEKSGPVNKEGELIPEEDQDRIVKEDDKSRQENEPDQSGPVHKEDKSTSVYAEDASRPLNAKEDSTLVKETDTSMKEEKPTPVYKEDPSRLVYKEEKSEPMTEKEKSKPVCKEVEVQTVCFQSTQTSDTHLDDADKTTKQHSQMLLQLLPMLAGGNGLALVKTPDNNGTLSALGTSNDAAKLYMDKTRSAATPFDLVPQAGCSTQGACCGCGGPQAHSNRADTGIATPSFPLGYSLPGRMPGKELPRGMDGVPRQNISCPIFDKVSSIYVPPFASLTHTLSPSSISHTERPAPVSVTWSLKAANTQPTVSQSLLRSSTGNASFCSISKNLGFNTSMPHCLPSLSSGFGINSITSYIPLVSKPGVNTATQLVNTSKSSDATFSWNSPSITSTSNAKFSWNSPCITSSNAIFSWNAPSIATTSTTSVLGNKTIWSSAACSTTLPASTGVSTATAGCSSSTAPSLGPPSTPFVWNNGTLPPFTIGVSPSASTASFSQSKPPLSTSASNFQFGSPVSSSTQFKAPTSSMFSWKKSESKSTPFKPFVPFVTEKVNLGKHSYGSQGTRSMADGGMDISMDSYCGHPEHTPSSSNNHVKEHSLFVFGATAPVSESTTNKFKIGQNQIVQSQAFSSAFSGSRSPKPKLSSTCTFGQQSNTAFQSPIIGQINDRISKQFNPTNPGLFVFGGNTTTSTISKPTFSFGMASTAAACVVSNNNPGVVMTGSGFVFSPNIPFKPVCNTFGQTVVNSPVSSSPSLSPTGFTSPASNQTATSPFRFSSPLGFQSEPMPGPSSHNDGDIHMDESDDTVMAADRKSGAQHKDSQYVFSIPITKTKSGQSLQVETNEMVSAFSSTCVNRESSFTSTDGTCSKSVLFGGVKDFSNMEWEMSDHDLQDSCKSKDKSVKFALSDIDVKFPAKTDVASCSTNIEPRSAQDSDSSTGSGGFYLDYTPAPWLTEAAPSAKPDKLFPTFPHRPSKSSPSLAIKVMKNNALKLMNEESKRVEITAPETGLNTDQTIQFPAPLESSLNTDQAMIQPPTPPDLFVFTGQVESSSASSPGLTFTPPCASSSSWSGVPTKVDYKPSAFSGRGGNVSTTTSNAPRSSSSNSSTNSSTSSSSSTSPQSSDSDDDSERESSSSDHDKSDSEEEWEQDFEERKLVDEGKHANTSFDFLSGLPSSSDSIEDLPSSSGYFSSSTSSYEGSQRRMVFARKYRRPRGRNKSWNAVPTERSYRQNDVQATCKLLPDDRHGQFQAALAQIEILFAKKYSNTSEGNRSWNAVTTEGASRSTNVQSTYKSLSVLRSICHTDLDILYSDLCVTDCTEFREDLPRLARPADDVGVPTDEGVNVSTSAAADAESVVCCLAACMPAFSVLTSHCLTGGGFGFTKPETNNNSTVSGTAAPSNAVFQFGAAKPNEGGGQPNAGFNFNATPANLNTQATSFNFAAGSAPGAMAFSAQPEAPSGQKRQIKKAVRKIRR